MSDARATLRAMWLVHVVCSGPECEEEIELIAESVDELDRLNCDCGYGFAVVSVAEATLIDPPGGADVISIAPRDGEERAAA
jgi:hypothetical protein